jgi:hypothetical protein
MTKFKDLIVRPLQNLIKLAFLSFRAREARHGIQYYQAVPGFRVKPGMTIRGLCKGLIVVVGWVEARNPTKAFELSTLNSPGFAALR